MKEQLTLALPKGRLLDAALRLLHELGVDGVDQDSRKLIFTDVRRGLRLLLLKPTDIPAYVLYGAADLGIVGKDVLLEQEPDVYEPLDLGFGFCRLVVAEPRELWERDDPAKWSWVRVATKYPRLAEQYFTDRGIQVEIVRLDGSIELAPLVGLAERIVDLVQSGETLRANGLVEVAEITRSTARLIVNRASMKTEHAHRRAEGRRPPERARAARERDAAGDAHMIRTLDARRLGVDAVVAALERSPETVAPEIHRTVDAILAAVRARGDTALCEYTAQLDGFKTGGADDLVLRAADFETAERAIPPDVRAALEYAADRIERYHAAAMPKSWRITDEHGSVLGQEIRPLDRVGVYVPGGRAAYPSTVLMTVVPARVAGVREIVLVTPPGSTGRIEPTVLAAARIAGVTEGYRAGLRHSIDPPGRQDRRAWEHLRRAREGARLR